MASDLVSVAVYRRAVGASIERVWENVHDWEHLPWLHAGSFASITLVDRGDWGWKAKIGLHGGGEILLELVLEEDAPRYVSRTLEGPGAGTEIWTTLAEKGEQRTDIEVEFLVPGVVDDAKQGIGNHFVSLYTRLWDEDEEMMQQRTAELARRGGGGEAPGIDLGPEEELKAAPRIVEFGRGRFRVLFRDGEWIVHSAVCPHWLGPLDESEVQDGQVTCPWHGYRFDCKTGERRDASSPMRLAPAPKLVLADGRVRLVPR